MRRIAIELVFFAACGSSHAPVTPAVAPVAVEPAPLDAAPPICRIVPLVRADGLLELRGRPGELENAPCDAGPFAPALAWLAGGDRMLLAPRPGAFNGALAPLAIRDIGDALVIDVASATEDLRCTGPGDRDGERVPIDLPDQAIGSWLQLDATDRPLRLAFSYTTGGCTYERHGDRVTIHLQTEYHATATARYGGDDREPRYRVEGSALVVEVPYGSIGGCRGEGPGPDEPYVESHVSTGYLLDTIEVPATATHVIVRASWYSEPPCA
ncbi:MAG TPA: hypothetical protein VL463_31185 [Kofleriaceae bacterium]|nr:hypothetical protein [Kofleriaceae bacterium]